MKALAMQRAQEAKMVDLKAPLDIQFRRWSWGKFSQWFDDHGVPALRCESQSFKKFGRVGWNDEGWEGFDDGDGFRWWELDEGWLSWMRCQESKDYLEFKREAKLRTAAQQIQNQEMPTRWAPTKYSYTWSYGAPINGSCKDGKWDLQPCL